MAKKKSDKHDEPVELPEAEPTPEPEAPASEPSAPPVPDDEQGHVRHSVAWHEIKKTKPYLSDAEITAMASQH